MRFDAVYFIDLCQQAGFKITRQGHLLCYDYRGKRIQGADFFIEAMRQHKADILPLLADTLEVIQLDIFYDAQ
jgi:hypothetical protein